MRHETQIAFLRKIKLYFLNKTLKMTGVKYGTIFPIRIFFWFNFGALKMRPFPNKFVRRCCSVLKLISFDFSLRYSDDRVTVVIFDKTTWSDNAISNLKWNSWRNMLGMGPKFGNFNVIYKDKEKFKVTYPTEVQILSFILPESACFTALRSS
jgi:hypothetical protein